MTDKGLRSRVKTRVRVRAEKYQYESTPNVYIYIKKINEIFQVLGGYLLNQLWIRPSHGPSHGGLCCSDLSPSSFNPGRFPEF